MKSYIGCKIIRAEPEVKNGVQGYKVVYPNIGKSGEYVSWSPKDVFELAYRPIQIEELNALQK